MNLTGPILAAALALALPGLAAAEYPERAVEVIIPSGPGSGMDNLGRTIAAALESELGQPFPAINKPGAGHSAAARYVVEAPADGYTLLITHPQILVSAATGILGFEPLDELVPLARTGRMENFIASPAGAPFDNLAELREVALAQPGEINAAVDGILGIDHIVLVQLAKEMGVELNYVNVPGGGPEKVRSLMGEFTSLGTLGPGPFAGVKRSGDLKGIATLTNSDEPAIAFPDVPTTRMQGYSTEFSLSWWWFVRADTPDDVVAKLEAAFAKVMNDPAVQEEIVARGITEPAYDDAATARQQITDQLAGIQEILEELRDDVQQ